VTDGAALAATSSRWTALAANIQPRHRTAVTTPMSGVVREFVPLREGTASIYLCGATVQGLPYIGHVRSGVASTCCGAWLAAKGYDVAFVRNVTRHRRQDPQQGADAGSPWGSGQPP